jgi:predicted aspartyl protease
MKAFLFCSIAAAGLLFAEETVAEPSSLKAFFASEGFAGAPLQRRFGNHLFVSTLINKQRTRLMIDTGSPHTLIDKGSARRLGLNVEATKLRVGRLWGGTREHFGASKLETLAMGNCMLLDVPVMTADESEINYYSHLSPLDGLFGAHEMLRFGMVIDCARQMLYINPRGASGETSKRLANFLARRGFTRIPMQFNFHRHFEVEAAIDGHATRLVVDTGMGTTTLGKQLAAQTGVATAARTSKVKELAVGEFKIKDADVTVASVAGEIGPGILGEEYLSWNFAVIDVGGLALYLRHPDSR